MTNDVDITLVGDKELHEVLKGLNYATQHKFLKAILRDTSAKTVVPFVRQATPRGKTGNLRKSIGTITGKSKSTATVFVGPRMSHRRTAEGDDGYRGWVANILEFAKPHDRVPENAKAFKPFFGGAAGPGFVRKVGPIRKKTNLTWAIKSRLQPAEVHMTKAIRTVIERAWKKKGGRRSTPITLTQYAQGRGRE